MATPEELARQQIDALLQQCGWLIQDYKKLEDKEVNVGSMSDPEDARETVRDAMELYQKQFAATR